MLLEKLFLLLLVF